MTIIGDKFSQFKTSIINLVGTRASRNIDNLTAVGKANIEALASGIPKSSVGNVCTETVNPAYSGTTWDTLTVTGTFSGEVPTGKSTKGISLNSSVVDVTPIGTVGILASSLSDASSGTTTVFSPIKLTMFINASGTVIARRYVASYNAPTASADTIWYDLNDNLLKTWTGSTWSQPSPVVGFKIGEVTLSGTSVQSVVFDKGFQLLDAGTISRAFNSSTVPVGTVIAYMGTDIPSGFILMDGRYLSKTTYAALYAVIGDTQTTTAKNGYFQIADMTDGRYLMGSTVTGANSSWTNAGGVSGTVTYKETSSSGTYLNSKGYSYSSQSSIPPSTVDTKYLYTCSTGDTRMLRSFTATVTTANSKFGWGNVHCYAFDMNGLLLGGVTPRGDIFVGDKSTQPTQTFTINKYISGAYYWLITLDAWGGGVSATAAITVSNATWACYNNQVRVVGGTYSAGMPNITGGISINAPAAPIADYPSNAFTQGAQIKRLGGEQGKTSHQILFSAHDSNQLYGSDSTVVPESLGTQFCIKY